MFRMMLKDILNHPSLHEAASRFKKIEESQREILLRLSEIKNRLECEGPPSKTSESPPLQDSLLEMLSLDIADLSKRVYFPRAGT